MKGVRKQIENIYDETKAELSKLHDELQDIKTRLKKIQDNKNKIIRLSRLNELPVDFYRISSNHLIAYLSTLTIDVYITLFNKAVSVSPGANTAFADILI